jgi:hypothetical protein
MALLCHRGTSSSTSLPRLFEKLPWKLLNATCIEYELGIVDREALAKAYREGEVRIGQMKADPFQKPAGAVEVAKTQADASR